MVRPLVGKRLLACILLTRIRTKDPGSYDDDPLYSCDQSLLMVSRFSDDASKLAWNRASTPLGLPRCNHRRSHCYSHPRGHTAPQENGRSELSLVHPHHDGIVLHGLTYWMGVGGRAGEVGEGHVNTTCPCGCASGGPKTVRCALFHGPCALWTVLRPDSPAVRFPLPAHLLPKRYGFLLTKI